MPFSRLRHLHLDILAILNLDTLPTPATISPATPLFFPVQDPEHRRIQGVRREAFSQHSAPDLRQFLIENADLCEHLRISRVEYFRRAKNAVPSSFRIWYAEISKPEIKNYMIFHGLAQPEPNTIDGMDTSPKKEPETLMYVPKRF
jgi:hypothetical protein